MRYYLIAGEASGDLHGSNLIKAIKAKDNNAVIQCWGGDLMEAAGGTLVKHYRALAFMGLVEVLMNLRTILSNIKFCKKDIEAFQPDVLICIDYPGFNLRIAEWAKQKGIKVIYFIAPQVWAWKENRVPAMRKNIDRLLCILPFEKAYFKDRWNWDVDYVGHPLMQVLATQKNLPHPIPEIEGQNIIALLPGSRKQEINIKLPIMLSVAAAFPEYEFVVAKAPGQEDSFYEPFLKQYHNVSAVRNETYLLLLQSKAALVTSGTATLETALLQVPEVVCYKGSNVSYQIAKRLIKIKYIALVNLIMDKLVVKELIQNELTTQNLIAELDLLLNNQEKKTQLQNDYTALKNILSVGGNASQNAAQTVYQTATS